MTPSCTVCALPNLAELDELLHADVSWRQLEKQFPVGRGAIGRHAAKCCGIVNVSPKSRRAAKRRLNRRLAAIDADVKPIESAEDVIADLQRLRVEAYTLFERAKAAGDWKQAQLHFNQIAGLVDRFAEMHRVLGPKGATTVNVDRSQRVLNVVSQLSDENLRKLVAGEPVELPPTFEDSR